MSRMGRRLLRLERRPWILALLAGAGITLLVPSALALYGPPEWLDAAASLGDANLVGALAGIFFVSTGVLRLLLRRRRLVEEELDELKGAIAGKDQNEVADEIGDLLFAVVNLSRKCKLDSESMLQAAIDKFVRRFNCVEDELRKRGKKLGEAELPELDEIWDKVKNR